MRLLTLNVLRNCKYKPRPASPPGRRQASSDVLRTTAELEPEGAAENGGLVEVCGSWGDEHAELRTRVVRGLRVLPDFVSAREEEALLAELEPVLRRMRYQFDHWDNAIHGYRETERAAWRAENEAVLQRVRALAFGPAAGGVAPLPAAHVLDLAPAGHIKPHVDAVRFCGGVIAGLCLCSAAVMHLQHTEHAHLALHALLPRRALYIMTGAARHQFTHSVPGGAASAHSTWRGQHVPRARRVSVIVRARPDAAAAPPPPGEETAE